MRLVSPGPGSCGARRGPGVGGRSAVCAALCRLRNGRSTRGAASAATMFIATTTTKTACQPPASCTSTFEEVAAAEPNPSLKSDPCDAQVSGQQSIALNKRKRRRASKEPPRPS